MLGCESPPQGYDSWKFAWMGDFLDLKITTSWIGGVAGDEEGGGSGNGRGAVLAFFHGIEGEIILVGVDGKLTFLIFRQGLRAR